MEQIDFLKEFVLSGQLITFLDRRLLTEGDVQLIVMAVGLDLDQQRQRTKEITAAITNFNNALKGKE